MRLETRREFVRAGAVSDRDKKQFVRLCRMQRGENRLRARQSNWRGRQACTRVGVIGRIGNEIVVPDITIVTGTYAVDDSRVGLQTHTAAQPIDEHRCDTRPLLAKSGFL